MSEIRTLRAIESTNAVNRIIGEALGEALDKLDHVATLLTEQSERSAAHSMQLKELQTAAGTQARLTEQYSGDLNQYAKVTNAELAAIRGQLRHIQEQGCSRVCPPTDPSPPPAEEQTDPAIPRLAVAK